jgi:nitrogenase-associated protein
VCANVHYGYPWKLRSPKLSERLDGEYVEDMTYVLFFEKPGCANNTRQKGWLAAAGHEVEAVSLLAHPWTRDELLSYFGALPVAQWFNRAAPRVKSGEVVPESLDAAAALQLMLAEPLLIRRPLLRVGERREVGFDVPSIHAWLGLPESVVKEHGGAAPRSVEACLKTRHAPECPAPSKR